MPRDRAREDERIDGRDTAWHHFLTDVDDLLATGSYTWALPTLSGIRETVERTGRVTVAQRRAVQNIRDGLWPGRRR